MSHDFGSRRNGKLLFLICTRSTKTSEAANSIAGDIAPRSWRLLLSHKNLRRRILGCGYWLEVGLLSLPRSLPLTIPSYALQWLLTLPLELVAASIALQYWGNPLRHHSVWVTFFLLGIVTINVFGVRWFALAEVVLSLIKVIAIAIFM